MSPTIRSQDAIRRGPANFVEKVQSALLQRLYPDSVPWVRGNVVAAGSVVEAIVKHGTMESYEMFAHPSFKEAPDAELKSYARSAPGAPQVTVTALNEALREGLERHPLMVWFDPLPLPSIQRSTLGKTLLVCPKTLAGLFLRVSESPILT